MKRFTLIISFVCILFTLLGCQSENKEMVVLDQITKISVSNSDGFGGLNENYIFSSQENKLTSSFEEIIERTTLVNKELSQVTPDYDILVEYENQDTQGLHLILGSSDQESYLTYIGYEDKVYRISQNDIERIRGFLNI
ncbi:hypothetical protein [Guptibacillus spartinae]|uniref:hypothetical protein n=1 Tax=Guptibacillus spartinae TaxID=3025679 RepID=UPI00235DF199|nr:hypothetical protein [Pseudalkalibacillus spartinae]